MSSPGSGSILDPECSLLAKRFNRTLGPLVHSGNGDMRHSSVGDHMNANPYEKWSNGSDGIGIGASNHHSSSSKGIFGNGEEKEAITYDIHIEIRDMRPMTQVL